MTNVSPTTTEHADPTPQLFHYHTPDLGGRAKKVSVLARTDHGICAVQRVTAAGRNNLHSHTFADGFWMVIKGRARFYTKDDALVADLSPFEGVLIPREFPYWFESAGDEELEILQFEAKSDRPEGDERPLRVDYERPKRRIEIDG